MKTILIHAYTQVNLGDDLFLRILKNRYPDTFFTLISKNGHPQYNQFEEFKRPIINIWERIVRKIISFVSSKSADNYVEWVTDKKISKKYDAYLILGGSMFMQHDSSIGYVERLYKYFIDTINQSFVIGANFGPFTRLDFFEYYKTEIFNKCNSIVFRDSYSANLFASLSNVSTKPDIVFQYNQITVEKIPNSVGISVIDLSSRPTLLQYDKKYVSFIVEFINQLLINGKSVYLYSFCKFEGDEITIERIISFIRHPNLHIVKYTGDIENVLQSFGAMEMMLATRFHAMILSILYNQKMIPIIYSDKMTQVLDDIDYDGERIDIKHIDEYCINDLINKLYTSNFTLPEWTRKESVNMFKDLDHFISDLIIK